MVSVIPSVFPVEHFSGGGVTSVWFGYLGGRMSCMMDWLAPQPYRIARHLGSGEVAGLPV